MQVSSARSTARWKTQEQSIQYPGTTWRPHRRMFSTSRPPGKSQTLAQAHQLAFRILHLTCRIKGDVVKKSPSRLSCARCTGKSWLVHAHDDCRHRRPSFSSAQVPRANSTRSQANRHCHQPSWQERRIQLGTRTTRDHLCRNHPDHRRTVGPYALRQRHCIPAL